MCDPAFLPAYIPPEWADRIEIVTDEKGVHYLWTGWHNGKGHGKVSVGGKEQYTHRVVYQRGTGVKLERFDYVDHLCERKPCLNLDHLEHVPPAVNTARGPGRSHQFKPAGGYRERRTG